MPSLNINLHTKDKEQIKKWLENLKQETQQNLKILNQNNLTISKLKNELQKTSTTGLIITGLNFNNNSKIKNNQLLDKAKLIATNTDLMILLGDKINIIAFAHNTKATAIFNQLNNFKGLFLINDLENLNKPENKIKIAYLNEEQLKTYINNKQILYLDVLNNWQVYNQISISSSLDLKKQLDLNKILFSPNPQTLTKILKLKPIN